MVQRALPRVTIAGLAGDSGKTLVSLGLIATLRSRGYKVAPFKKGPDFIDSAWAGEAAGFAGRNLDTFLMSEQAVLRSLSSAALDHDIAVIEGNRGLFDGLDAKGTHSTAYLAKLVRAPVVLLVDAIKATRTVAAQVKGCQAIDPDLWIAGVILNRVGTKRQEKLIREAIALETGLPLLGAIPRLPDKLPIRHLGLLTAIEHPDTKGAVEKAAEEMNRYVDVSEIARVASQAPAVSVTRTTEHKPAARVRIGVLRDRAFSFYYPENLSALETAGAELVSISPITDAELPDIDGLYAGGGFPEVYADQLSANRTFRVDLKKRIDQGLPVWAECGGLMYLSRSITVQGTLYPMVGVLPVSVEQIARPQGHGYVQATVDADNPFYNEGHELRGHEFHYSRIREEAGSVPTVLILKRGIGLGHNRDGLLVKNTLASYIHIHALGEPDWATAVVRVAKGEHTYRDLTVDRTKITHQHHSICGW
ncbi:MAG: hydrogenobyrinic acid a,c-diamide synthase (glutamine-hydrolyzing) [Deltaproteobacteria bacterium]|nr:hydrogenobyrinic acid a,c-diamide synthase (glutamine-hydrolyzing) [Deltaproteobacteria bacterium]